jgi:hypothetical protein
MCFGYTDEEVSAIINNCKRDILPQEEKLYPDKDCLDVVQKGCQSLNLETIKALFANGV